MFRIHGRGDVFGCEEFSRKTLNAKQHETGNIRTNTNTQLTVDRKKLFAKELIEEFRRLSVDGDVKLAHPDMTRHQQTHRTVKHDQQISENTFHFTM